MDFNHFESKALSVHGHKYNYTRVNLINNKTKVEIVCPVHGPFNQTPDRHLRGAGCRKCSRVGTTLQKPPTPEEFFAQAAEVHEGFYDYTGSTFEGMNSKISMTCPIHGRFETSARKHLQEKRGCPSCGRVRTKYSGSILFQDFFDAAVDRHGFNYDYSDVSLRFFSDDIHVTCPKHGEFQVTASGHLHGKGCPGCRPSGSCPENELADFIEGLGFNVVRNSRKIIAPFELDIVIPELNVAFEFNGIFWHSEQAGKEKSYHQRKTERTTAAGFRLLHVYESDWDLNQDHIKDRVCGVLQRAEATDLSQAYAIHEYDGRHSLVLRGEVVGYFYVKDGVALDSWGKFGASTVKRLLDLTGVKYLKVNLDWPEFTSGELSSLGLTRLRNIGPERRYFDKKTLRRLKEKPAVAGFDYLSVVDSGSVIWVVEDGVHD